MDPLHNVIRSFFEENIYNSDSARVPLATCQSDAAALNAVNPVGTTHTVTATVTDINGNPCYTNR